jgi:hypothetical protein
MTLGSGFDQCRHHGVCGDELKRLRCRWSSPRIAHREFCHQLMNYRLGSVFAKSDNGMKGDVLSFIEALETCSCRQSSAPGLGDWA